MAGSKKEYSRLFKRGVRWQQKLFCFNHHFFILKMKQKFGRVISASFQRALKWPQSFVASS
jgi:hypothetical protein